MALGIGTVVLVVLAFTRIPYDAHRWLGTAGGTCDQPPDVILLLGGSGMPSGPELMRCDAASTLAKRVPTARIILVIPNDSLLAEAMSAELVAKGVVRSRIELLMHGRNTREQAMDAKAALPRTLHRHTAIVTAPENMYRTLLTFRKIGFTAVCGVPAFDHALFDDLRYQHLDIGGRPYVPDVSTNMDLRYNFWNQLKLEITCLREYAALAYYKANGWV